MARLLGATVPAFAGVPSTKPQAAAAAVPEDTRKAHQALRELDRFLDHHPLIEEDLRQSPQLMRDATYLHTNSELRDFLQANPAVGPALALEPRHLLRRALMLQASAPLHWSELAQLDPLLDRQPSLELALNRNPELIHEESFLRTHSKLQDFLTEHSTLGRAFLPTKGR